MINSDNFYKKLNPELTFENFIVGKSNESAYNEAIKMTIIPEPPYNILTIIGASGTGKTHLIHAIGNSLKSKKISLNILYLECCDYIQYFIKYKYVIKIDNYNVLFFENIHMLCGNEIIYSSFFHLFNEMHNKKSIIILTSTITVCDPIFSNVPDRIRSRFEWGMVVELQQPDFETRKKIVIKYPKRKNIELTKDIIDIIADKLVNPRYIETALYRLEILISQKHPLNNEIADKYIRDLY